MRFIGLDDLAPYLDDPDEAPKLRPASDFCDAVIDRFYGDNAIQGARLPWAKAEFSIAFRPGEVTLWLGMNGHGKSLLLGQLMLWWMTHGDKSCLASFEMKPEVSLQRMCRQAAQCAEPTIDFIRRMHRWTDGKLWMYDQQGTVKAERVLSVCRYFADQIKGQHVVIDSLMKCGIDEDAYNRQKWFIDELTAIARDKKIHIHLVHHSRKLEDEKKPPGKMDAKGTGAITDQVDNCITVWRNKRKEREVQAGKFDEGPDAMMIVDKQRNGEWEGAIALWFHKQSQQYVPLSNNRPMDLLMWDRE